MRSWGYDWPAIRADELTPLVAREAVGDGKGRRLHHHWHAVQIDDRWGRRRSQEVPQPGWRRRKSGGPILQLALDFHRALTCAKCHRSWFSQRNSKRSFSLLQQFTKRQPRFNSTFHFRRILDFVIQRSGSRVQATRFAVITKPPREIVFGSPRHRKKQIRIRNEFDFDHGNHHFGRCRI